MTNENPTAENPPATNPSRESSPGAIPEQATPASLEAGRAALSQHTAETTKRGRGRPITHGRYAGQRKKPREIPLGKMGNGAAPVLLEEIPAETVPLGTEEIQPAFDEQVNREYASIAIEFLVSLKNAASRKRLMKETNNEEFTEAVMENRGIGEKPRSAIETGLVRSAQKYNLDLSKTPEGMVFGGLLIYIAQDNAATTAAIAKYFKMRPEEAKP